MLLKEQEFNAKLTAFKSEQTHLTLTEVIIAFIDFIEANTHNDNLDATLEKVKDLIQDGDLGILRTIFNAIKLRVQSRHEDDSQG